MNLKLNKSYSFSDVTDYLEHVITLNRLHVATKIGETICTLKYPTNTTKLRFLYGLCNVFRLFVSNFARKAAPLN